MTNGSSSTPSPLGRRSRRLRLLAVAAPGVIGIAVLLFVGPIPQDPAYHRFADESIVCGVPHFGDVVTNLAFVLVGLHGLGVIIRRRRDGRVLADPRDAYGYLALFGGTVLTGLGSAWYHLDPTTPSLFWDRLPMTVVFTSLVAVLIGERVSPPWGRRLLLPLLIVGAGSALQWHLSELAGRGDVRWYGFVQFYPILALILVLRLFPPRYTHAHYFWALAAGYGVAKVFEVADAAIWSLNGVVSGHSLKHVFAALGMWAIVGMLRVRAPLAQRRS